jgi:hypothetical protein
MDIEQKIRALQVEHSSAVLSAKHYARRVEAIEAEIDRLETVHQGVLSERQRAAQAPPMPEPAE